MEPRSSLIQKLKLFCWLVFCVGAFVIALSIPYRWLSTGINWSQVPFVLMWLVFAWNAYDQIVNPQTPSPEVRAIHRKAATTGLSVLAGSIPVATAALMATGDELAVAALMAVFIATACGLLAWWGAGVYWAAGEESKTSWA